MKNALYFGDNLNVMREMQTGSYHTCYLDPPFNSGRNYNIFLAGSKAQRKAFDDIWRWDDTARENQAAVLHYDGRHPELVETMGNLSDCLTGFDNILKGGVNGQKRSCIDARVSRLHGAAPCGDLAFAHAGGECVSPLRPACKSLFESDDGYDFRCGELPKRDYLVL